MRRRIAVLVSAMAVMSALLASPAAAAPDDELAGVATRSDEGGSTRPTWDGGVGCS